MEEEVRGRTSGRTFLEEDKENLYNRRWKESYEKEKVRILSRDSGQDYTRNEERDRDQRQDGGGG